VYSRVSSEAVGEDEEDDAVQQADEREDKVVVQRWEGDGGVAEGEGGGRGVGREGAGGEGRVAWLGIVSARVEGGGVMSWSATRSC
jgi:hypothetical protein